MVEALRAAFALFGDLIASWGKIYTDLYQVLSTAALGGRFADPVSA